jgi:hypothetical protein
MKYTAATYKVPLLIADVFCTTLFYIEHTCMQARAPTLFCCEIINPPPPELADHSAERAAGAGTALRSPKRNSPTRSGDAAFSGTTGGDNSDNEYDEDEDMVHPSLHEVLFRDCSATVPRLFFATVPRLCSAVECSVNCADT